jgi:hypothetical protein
LADDPTSLAEMLLALDFAAGEPREIVIVVPHGRGEAAPFLAELRRQFVPNRVLVVAVEGQGPRPPGRARTAAGREVGCRRQSDGLRLQAAGLRAADVGSGGVRPAAPGRRRVPVEQ